MNRTKDKGKHIFLAGIRSAKAYRREPVIHLKKGYRQEGLPFL